MRPGEEPAGRCGRGQRKEARGGREGAARQSEAGGRSAERQVAGKPETGPLPSAEGQNPVRRGRPERRSVSVVRARPRGQMAEVKGRPRTSIGLRN